MKRAIWRLNKFILKSSFAFQIFKLYLLSFIVPLAFTPLFYVIVKVFGESKAGPNKSHWFLAIVIAPIVETLIFQYGVFKILQASKFTRDKYGIYIFISALLFGFVHWYSLRYIVFAFSAGLTLGYTYYLYHKRPEKAFWTTTLVHSLHNLSGVLIFYLTN